MCLIPRPLIVLSHTPPYSLRLKAKPCGISPLLPVPRRCAAGIARRVLQPPLPAGTRERKVFVEYRTCDRLRERCRNAAPEGSSTRSWIGSVRLHHPRESALVNRFGIFEGKLFHR